MKAKRQSRPQAPDAAATALLFGVGIAIGERVLAALQARRVVSQQPSLGGLGTVVLPLEARDRTQYTAADAAHHFMHHGGECLQCRMLARHEIGVQDA